MKKWFLIISLLLSVAVLFGCATAAPGEKDEGKPETVGRGEVQAPVEGRYEIRDVEKSYLDEEGRVLIRVTYQHVVLSSLETGADKINDALEAQLEAFYEERDGLNQYLEGPFLSPESPYFYDTTAKVLHYGNRVLSIRYLIDWYMGGVQNSTSQCVNFDVITGQELTLRDLFPEKEQQIRQTILDYIGENAGEDLLGDPEQILSEIAYEDIGFFIEDGQVMVRFPIYLFASGAYGEPVVATGVMLED